MQREGFWNETNKCIPTDWNNKAFTDKLQLIQTNIKAIDEVTWVRQGRFSILTNTAKPRIYAEQYLGFHKCIICGCKNGSADYVITEEKEQWTYPEGFLHYVIEHSIKPSDKFITFIMGVDPKCFVLDIDNKELITLNVIRIMRDML